MKTQTQTIVNGVNVSQLFETIDNIKENKKIAKFNFRAKNKWISGTENHTTVEDFYGACQTHKRKTPHIFIKDEPELLLGKDKGANPVEYLLAGLAGCVTTSLVAYASAKGVKIDSIESTLEGDIDLQGLFQLGDVNPGYQGISISFKIESDASEETLQELIELAKNVSPVANTISRPTPINVTLVN
jgi:uncharacterized OsmC-like protein